MNEIEEIFYQESIFIYLYMYILFHVTVEFFVRKYLKVPTLKETRYAGIYRASWILRILIILSAIAIIYPMIYVYGLLALFFGFPIGYDIFFSVKWILLFSWIILTFMRIYFEYKTLTVVSALITLFFNIPLIVFLTAIYYLLPI
ncbi:hypothetical protein GPDM_02160 [Planococcus donghaensis MPA1U2]|uniref:Uncharacterized protein n=1 Tax=Planococcus donghaensis MPA1U2 TaxID=933115 RepID=E7RDA4_9BACL|nr:hypothetical protein [Planococcus donghaensis]EGA91054.1 hypothetical protein GPDM_02160 [Planococcus donghaensis MPA1U2]